MSTIVRRREKVPLQIRQDFVKEEGAGDTKKGVWRTGEEEGQDK